MTQRVVLQLLWRDFIIKPSEKGVVIQCAGIAVLTERLSHPQTLALGHG